MANAHVFAMLLVMIGSVVLRFFIIEMRDKRPSLEPKPAPPMEFGIFQPVFFQDLEYLRLLLLRELEDASCAIELVRECCRSVELPHTDIQALFAHPNWRAHLVATVALIVSGPEQKTVESAWRMIDSGSWVTPQIAAAMCLIDANFVAEAVGRLEILCPLDPSEFQKLCDFERQIAMGRASARQRAAKTAAALLRLLEIKQPAAAYKLYGNQDLQFLLKADIDRSGEIAEHWLARIRSLTADESKLQL